MNARPEVTRTMPRADGLYALAFDVACLHAERMTLPAEIAVRSRADCRGNDLKDPVPERGDLVRRTVIGGIKPAE